MTRPTIDLFFHELKDRETMGKRIVEYIIAGASLLILVIRYPFIEWDVKLATHDSTIDQKPTKGRSGKIFNRLQSRLNEGLTGFSSILYKTGLYKLPNLTNILKKETYGVGPAPFAQEKAPCWNNRYDDFYKRYVVAPGMIPVVKSNREARNSERMAKQLKKEFKYVLSPTAKSDLRVLFSNF